MNGIVEDGEDEEEGTEGKKMMVSSAASGNSVCCRFDEFDVTAFFVVYSTLFCYYLL